jgi:hypothetical protein
MTAAEAAQLDQVLEEGQSVVRVTILPADNAASLIAAAITGKPEAWHLLRTIKDAIDHIETAPDAMYCLRCERPFSPTEHPEALAVLEAAHDAPTTGAIISGICAGCCRGGRAALQDAVLSGYRDHYKLHARRLPPLVATAGHA